MAGAPVSGSSPPSVGVVAAPEADAAQNAALDRDVLDLLGQGGGAGLDGHAVVAVEPAQLGGQAGLRRPRPWARAASGVLISKSSELSARDAPGPAVMAVGWATVDVVRRRLGAHRRVEAGHRQAVEGRLEHGLLVDAVQRGQAGEVVLLGQRQGAADGDGRRPPVRGPLAEATRDVEVEPLAVLEEVGVAVLVARAADEHGVLLGHPLRPVVGVGLAVGRPRRRRCCSRSGSPALSTRVSVSRRDGRPGRSRRPRRCPCCRSRRPACRWR